MTRGGANPPLAFQMATEDKQRRVVGVYDRPASADRNFRRWVPVAVAVVVGLAWLAYLMFGR